MLPKANLLASSSGSAGGLGGARPTSAGPLKPLKLVKQALPTPPTAGDTLSVVEAASTAASAAVSAQKAAQLQDLLALVRERYPSSEASAAVPTPEASASAAAVPSAAAVAASNPATAAVTPQSFTDAAASERVDKLAILMSLFKSRGIAPPPLPLFDQLEGPKLSLTDALFAPPPLPLPMEFAAPVSAPTVVASADIADSTDAEVAQLSTMFHHARGKITKLCRLYQSGILKGAGDTQAMEKLSALIRTYYSFIQQAKSHKHIDRMEAEIEADVKCASLQQLADRMYALAKS